MSGNKGSISKGRSSTEIGEYWDEHDLGEVWEETKPVEVEVGIRHEKHRGAVVDRSAVNKSVD
jgi:hypothetical protein